MKAFRGKGLSILGVVGLAWACPSYSAEKYRATLVPLQAKSDPHEADPGRAGSQSYADPGKAGSQPIRLDRTEVQVEFDEAKVPYVRIQGEFTKPNATLIHGKRKLGETNAEKPKLRFQIREVLTSADTPVEVVSVDAFGLASRSGWRVIFEDWAVATGRERKKVPNLFEWGSFSAGLGYSLLSYSETDEPDLSQTALTAKVFYRRPMGRKWDLALGGYYTALPVSSSVDGRSLRFIGINARAGIRLPLLPDPWLFSLLGGAYYTTTVAKPAEAFGFYGMFGPQVYPSLGRRLKRGDLLNFYFKLSPIFSDGKLSMQSRELAAGVSYDYRLKSGRGVVLSLDIAKLAIDVDDVVIDSTSITFGIGYRF